MDDATLKLPEGPFLSRDLDALGITRHQFRLLGEEGLIRRLGRGVYVVAHASDSIELRARAVALVVPVDHVVCDRTAAWIHGVDTMTSSDLEDMPPVESCSLPDGTASRRAGVDGHSRQLLSRDIVEVDGLRVTSPLRTALDLGARLHRKDALAAMDALCRAHSLRTSDLRRELKRFRGRRGVVQLRELVRLVDPRAESARESWTRLAIHDAGLPVPDLQHWIEVDGVRLFRLDIAYVARRIAVEYDGFDYHQRSKAQVERDTARRKWLRDHGWTVVVIRVGDFTEPRLSRWTGELRRALTPTYSNVRRLERGDRERRLTQVGQSGPTTANWAAATADSQTTTADSATTG